MCWKAALFSFFKKVFVSSGGSFSSRIITRIDAIKFSSDFILLSFESVLRNLVYRVIIILMISFAAFSMSFGSESFSSSDSEGWLSNMECSKRV